MEQKKQEIAKDVIVLSGAVVCGDVGIASGSSVWFNAVVRGDEAPITIGENTNIQDCAVLHVDEGCPLRIGNGVTVGHGAILHGCTVGDNALIGMGAIVLDGARIGKNCIVVRRTPWSPAERRFRRAGWRSAIRQSRCAACVPEEIEGKPPQLLKRDLKEKERYRT